LTTLIDIGYNGSQVTGAARASMEFQIPEFVTWKDLSSGVVLLDLKNGTYFTLNETASAIWKGMVAGSTSAGILAQLCDDYECTSEDAGQDLERTIAELLAEGLLTRQSTDSLPDVGA
jgi:hypothetical protein